MSTDRFSNLVAERFTLCDGDNATRHFEGDAELNLSGGVSSRGGSQKALVLVTLGLDDYDSHVVQLDYASDYDSLTAVSEAIETLELIRDQLAVMASASEVRAKEKAAFDVGVDAHRFGLVIPTQEAQS